MEVAPGELAARVGRLDAGGGNRPDDGARAPSQRIAIVPVVAAYLIALPRPIARPSSRSVIRLLPSPACIRSAFRTARWRPLASSGCRPSENSAKTRLGTTYVLKRGPHS